MAGFNNLSETFLTLLRCIPLRHREGCNTICNIIQNPELHGVRNLLIKDPQFISFITNSAQELVQAEIKSAILSNQLRLPVEEMNPRRLREFLLVAIDRVHKQESPFTRSLLQACVDSHDHIIHDLNLDLADDIFLLCNNIVDPPELEKQNLSKRNRALISVVSLALLCYGRNECSNMFQRVIGHYAFSGNISKRSVESFHQIGIIVSYESIRRGLQVNATAVMEEIIEKTRFHSFFISYDNMDFYENVQDQRLHNRSAIVNYTTRYICFMKPLKGSREDDIWLEHYIDSDQIDQRLVNTLANKDFDLTQPNRDHRSATNRYILSEVLGQYFSKSMHKQKNTLGVSIYRKWETPLPNIRCRNEVADILLLPTLPYNKGSIAGTIEILREIAERLGLSDEIVRDKVILLQGDLLTVRNCRRTIYRWQGVDQSSLRFHWLEPVAGLFHLQMNFLSMLFDRFWGVAGDIVSLNRYASILQRKYIKKDADNNHFHHSDDFLRTLIEVLVIALCIHSAQCSSIDSFHVRIERSNWPSLIGNVEESCLGITKVHSIQDRAFTRTNAVVAAALRAKKEE